MLSLSAAANLTYIILNGTSTQSMFSSLNIIQLFLLLPLIGTDIHEEVTDYLTSMNFSVFSMDFIPLEILGDYEDGLEAINYQQTN